MVMKTQDDKYCATKSSGLMGVEEKTSSTVGDSRNSNLMGSGF